MQASPSADKRLLVIDDHAAMTQVVRAAFQLYAPDWNVQIAATRDCGLASAARRAPAVVLIDRHLDGEDGVDVARALKNLPGMRHAAMILWSAQPAWAVDLPTDVAPLFAGLLPKMFDPYVLVGHILDVHRGRSCGQT